MSRASTPRVVKSVFTKARMAVVGVAATLILVAAVLSLVGMGSDVGVLSGTRPGSAGSAAAGLAYAGIWFGAVLLAPVLFLFVLFDVILERVPPVHTWMRSGRR